MNHIIIDFNKPHLIGTEMNYISEAFQEAHVSGDGIFTKKCQEILQQELNVPKVLLTTSCTHALEMSALLLNIQPGDEVIIPSFTFVSTINAFVLRGAVPVFIDIHPDTLNMDETRLEKLITPRTRAIVVVHYGGVGCEMDTILAIAQKYNLPVVEDNAHGLFGKYKGKPLGSFGCLATQSFHETKNISCGEGGALVFNETDLVDRAEIIREKGTNRSRFFRGMVDKYTWVDIGSSYLPSDILAAVLYAQLEVREQIQNRRQQIWNFYYTHLSEWASKWGIQLPTIPPDREQAFHLFYILLPNLEIRQKLMNDLRQEGIISVFHYLPLHLSDMGRQFGGKPGDCPVTESISDRLLRLPFYNTLTLPDQEMVVDALFQFKR